ncbi:formate/nitrite transporter family protein [Chitinispirillales bacterium ANBcel5]|uniref:formate/nitrite transporter family protein n=1 Tax=Cellulosispirillum alkaliphilum TaxID=3039283 RepID=UPI002A4FC81E|nr:formate/nitrite transporter family protein [Chitinispirillales bacterium ANBcel5]
MVEQSVEAFANMAVKKRDFAKKSPLRYFLLSMMAGVYVGFGIILIFTIGAPLSEHGSAFVRVVMGVSFGVALTLVIFAGSELFTGNNMILTIGSLSRKVKWAESVRLWTFCLLGNLAGSLLLAWVFVESGLGRNESTAQFIALTSQAKSAVPFTELFLRGILCNMLVCLAVWTSGRTSNDGAKVFLIFWCLFAFIGAGFEHSIANMTLIGVTLFLPDIALGEALAGFAANLIPVTLGNFVGGAVFIGAAYWYIASVPSVKTAVTSEKRLANESIAKE